MALADVQSVDERRPSTWRTVGLAVGGIAAAAGVAFLVILATLEE